MNYKIIDRVQSSKLKVGDVFIKDDEPNFLQLVDDIKENWIHLVMYSEYSFPAWAGCGSDNFNHLGIVSLTNLKLAFVER